MMEHLSLVPYEGGSGGGAGGGRGVGGKYKECMRNHAAAMGGQAFDGCGEFMADSPDSLKCAACGCHRSFHRRAASAAAPVFFRPPPPPPSQHHHVAALQAFLPSAPVPPPHLALPYHAVPAVPWNARAGSETPPRPEDFGLPGGSSGRKRFRTKFTPEQKERMREFAEKQGWRINRNDDGALERFCHEIGVRRQVLKVWMHNHKNHHGHKNQHLATSVLPSATGVGAPGGTADGPIMNPTAGTSTGNIPGMAGDRDDDDDDDTDDSPPRAAVSSPSPSPISV
jgi:ZF-HD class homeobox domain-containing protein